MSTTTIFDNLTVLSNAVDIGIEVIANVSGNQISNHLEGTPLNDRTVAAILAAELNNVIEGREHA